MARAKVTFDSMKHKSISRSALLVLAAALPLTVSCSASTGTQTAHASASPRELASSSGDTPAWSLWGWLDAAQGSSLCLEVRDPKAGSAGGGSECGFTNQPTDTTGYYASAPLVSQRIVDYGPLPATAVAVRLSAPGRKSFTVRSQPLPADFPAGRFWSTVLPGTAASGSPTWTAQPLDSQGKPVAFQAFD